MVSAISCTYTSYTSFFPALVRCLTEFAVYKSKILKRFIHSSFKWDNLVLTVSIFTSVYQHFKSNYSMLALHCGPYIVLSTLFLRAIQISLGSWWVSLVVLLHTAAAPSCQQSLLVEWYLVFLTNVKELSVDSLLLSIARTSSNWHDLIPTQA